MGTLKSPEEILTKYIECFTGIGDYYFTYVSEENTIKAMTEYAEQFRKPEKKTIEESLTGCRDEFKPALRTWLEYKAEKNQRYKPKGLESLVKKFNKFEGTPDQLMHVIESCMECNYAGIVWSKNYTYGNVTKQTRIENFEQGFREQFAGKDLSANDGF